MYTYYTMPMPMVYAMVSSIGAHVYIYYVTLLMPMVHTMTSSIGAHIYTLHYTMLTPMVHTMTTSIGAHIYKLHHAHVNDIHDDEFDRCAYINTTPCSFQWYTR